MNLVVGAAFGLLIGALASGAALRHVQQLADMQKRSPALAVNHYDRWRMITIGATAVVSLLLWIAMLAYVFAYESGEIVAWLSAVALLACLLFIFGYEVKVAAYTVDLTTFGCIRVVSDLSQTTVEVPWKRVERVAVTSLTDVYIHAEGLEIHLGANKSNYTACLKVILEHAPDHAMSADDRKAIEHAVEIM